MTDLKRKEYVRERIAEHIRGHDWSVPWSLLIEQEKVRWRNYADSLLSLKDDKGNPLLAVISEDQVTIPKHKQDSELFRVGIRRVKPLNRITLLCSSCNKYIRFFPVGTPGNAKHLWCWIRFWK